MISKLTISLLQICHRGLFIIILGQWSRIHIFAIYLFTIKSLSRKLKKEEYYCLNEVDFVTVIFSIEGKEGTIFDTSILWSTPFSFIALSAFIISNIINLTSIDDSKEVNSFFHKHSQHAVYCPMSLLLFSSSSVSIFIFLKANNRNSQYIFSAIIPTSLSFFHRQVTQEIFLFFAESYYRTFSSFCAHNTIFTVPFSQALINQEISSASSSQLTSHYTVFASSVLIVSFIYI